ncbi:MAG: DUF4229 domain-containing protein [Intrasporangium sp.]|uniref:DUF4229 domain-containing protein n=1 Tax=Intrasporangium sp. TaxID=1925024 RepID=UPI0026490030|nr:DUF4229 domain-containing protein [Intrasporangium sp.]MDN5796439.1 DUF4229 domain-containing protein [Intrasporangium sp.]
MLRYTVLRLLIFFGFTLLFWLVGLRHNPIVLIVLAAIASSVTSYVLLRGLRDEMTAGLVARHEARTARKGQLSADELAEDTEAEDGTEGQAGTGDNGAGAEARHSEPHGERA